MRNPGLKQYLPFIKEEFRDDCLWGIEWNADQPDRIVHIYEALKKLDLPIGFNLIDIAAGHGTTVNGLARLFPKSKFTILDIRRYDEWKNIAKSIIKLEIPLQKFITKNVSHYNVVMMLNSFRYWKSPGPSKDNFMQWLTTYADYFITSDGRLSFPRLEIEGIDYKHKLELYKIK
jgi:hypothetical protein